MTECPLWFNDGFMYIDVAQFWIPVVSVFSPNLSLFSLFPIL